MNRYLGPLRKLNSQLAAKAMQQALTSEDVSLLQEESMQAESTVLNALLTYPERSQQETFLNIQLNYVQEMDNELFRAAGEQEQARPCFSLYNRFAGRLYHSLPGLELNTLSLSDSFRTAQAAELNNRWKNLCKRWEGQLHEELLAEICQLPLLQLTDGSVVYELADYQYLKYYLSELETLSTDKAENPLLGSSLPELLIRLDFNSLRFFGYCTRLIREHLSKLDHPEDRAAALLVLAANLHSLKPLSEARYWPQGMPLLTRLKEWITEELKARVSVRIKRNLSVEETAIFEKLLFELGYTLEENLDVLARKISLHFSSKKQEHISGNSLRSKFSTKDTEVYFSIKSMLKNMLNKVNEFLRANGFPNEGLKL